MPMKRGRWKAEDRGKPVCTEQGCNQPREAVRSVRNGKERVTFRRLCHDHWNDLRNLRRRAKRGNPEALAQVLRAEGALKNGPTEVPPITQEEAAGLTAHNARTVMKDGVANPIYALQAARDHGGLIDAGAGVEDVADPFAVLVELVRKARDTVEGEARAV